MSQNESSIILERELENLRQVNFASLRLADANRQVLTQIKDLLLGFQTSQLQNSHPNPLNSFGRKSFSQADEDGITLEIIRRLNLQGGTYAEFGVGNGLENNTIILASLGWNGFWVGGEDLAFRCHSSDKFTYIKDWITLENIIKLTNHGLSSIKAESLDVVSLDLDGNDIYFVEKLLANSINPKLFIVEYNAKFIPPSKFQILYNANQKWTGDDYFGAALMNFVELFKTFVYDLVCCNSHTGSNAFFVKGEYSFAFRDVPKEIFDIYTPPRYHLYDNFGHKTSPKVVELIMNGQPDI
jgi:hypothetical protein